MSSFDETISRFDEGRRFAGLYYHAAAARFDALRELLATIEQKGGIEHSRRTLAEAAQAAADIVENLRHAEQALKQADRLRRASHDRG